MKNTNETADAKSKLSWLHKVKVVIAAFAFVAAGIFGATAVADIPAPEADETAKTHLSKDVKIVKDDGRFTPMSSGSWS